MKDLHCHLLYDIDDGPKDILESKRMLKRFYYENITDIVLTPHYISNTRYNLNNNQKILRLKELMDYIEEEKLGINLYLGNEVYLDEEIYPNIKKGEISTINNSKYILIEFPMHDEYLGVEEELKKLIELGYIPIIAHPERYTFYYENFSFFENLLQLGCLFQGNLGSLIGIYGQRSEKMITELLKRDMIQFMATDAHRSDARVLENMKKVREILFRLVGEERFIKLTETNFTVVINNY